MVLLGISACAAAPGASPELRFADSVVLFAPGPGAGFGADRMPGVVLGPPVGAGASAGSLDVVSLGREGTITLSFPVFIVDGPGPDLIVFENPFSDFRETGRVAVLPASDGGRPASAYAEWPCDPTATGAGFPGCAGVRPVLSNPDNGLDPTDPELAGGDPFDLADLGVRRARLLRVRDTGYNEYDGITGGFDLDAVAVIHGEPVLR